ncbi:MAG TPA: branched-chain amino acid ABC transporter ATP-binding protein/permease [Solirubrobacterales bacterium]|jgi:branched-chain amino acid transport system permease protein|nr:branched-chain amino acid ABC transporter ATP-binding protein/permease [Solirubrobacterales bacterium]
MEGPRRTVDNDAEGKVQAAAAMPTPIDIGTDLPGAGMAARINAGIASARSQVEDRLPTWLTGPIGNPLVHATVVLAVLIVWAINAPITDYNLYLAQLACIYVIATLGLNIPGGMGGALSLGHGAAFAIGVYGGGILAAKHGWPVWGTLPFALAIGFAAGIVMGAPAVRLGTLALAMVSLGWVLVVSDMIVQLKGLTGGVGGLVGISLRFSFNGALADPVATPILIFVVGWLTYLGHWWYRSSRFGRAALAARDESIGASVSGISIYRVRLETFAIGSAIGALAGALFGYLSLIITPASVSPSLSILFLVMLVLGGAGSRVGPVVGAVVLTLVPNWLNGYPHVNNFVYGGLLLGLAIFLPRGVMGGGRPSKPRPFGGLEPSAEGVTLPLLNGHRDEPSLTAATASAGPDLAPSPARAVATPSGGEEPVLRLSGVTRSFGEVQALKGVDFTVAPGEIVGLVGPNGSGKTTLLNVASGMYRANSGSVVLSGRDITRMPPHRIARAGMARTFQTPKVFPSLSIGEHLALATRERADSSPERVQEAVDTASALLKMGGMDIDDKATLARPVGTLAQGQLRFLEVAMGALHVPRVLLLDEPAAGLSASEMEGLERSAKALAEQGTGVVIVEHHLDLIRRLVDRVVVLHLGSLLWEGPSSELASAEEVRVAYLGINQ